MRGVEIARVGSAVLLVLALSVVIGCGGGSRAGGGGVKPSPPGAADMTGRIQRLDAAGDAQGGSFLLVSAPAAGASYDRAVVRITAGTPIWTAQGGARRTLAFGDLRAGMRVAVRFSGPVAESYPVQVTAADVQVLTPLRPDP